MDVNTLALELATARRASVRLTDYPCPPPQDIAQAYEVQNLISDNMGSAVVGWKVGVTSEIARKMLGVDEPFSGPLYDEYSQQSPGKISVSSHDLRIVEAEIGFRMKTDLAPRSQPYTKHEVEASIATVHPVFEVVNKRLPGDLKDNVCWLIADGGVDHAFIHGPGITYAPEMDLAAETVVVNHNGEFATEGFGKNAMGNPLDVVVWLANHLNARNKTLKANDWVSTGLIAGIVIVEAGSTLTAQYKTLGQITVEFT